MKLRYKIFFSILFVSLTTLFASSYWLINRNHLENIEREQEHSLNEYAFIETNIGNSVDFTSTEDTLRMTLARYIQFYAQRGVNLMMYRNGELFYADFTGIKEEEYSELLDVEAERKKVKVVEEEKKHYIMVSAILNSDGDVLIYARDISDLYFARIQSICLSIVLTAGFVPLLSLLSFLFSRWITKPVERLNEGANAISKGNYEVRIAKSKDEFKEVGIAFNKMAAAVENRTQELEDRAKELQVFIDDLSHEMNTPLTSIQGYAEFLLNVNTSEEQRRKAADTIRIEAKRMKDIYTKLMTLTLAREQKVEFFLVEVAGLFSEIRETFLLQLKEKKST